MSEGRLEPDKFCKKCNHDARLHFWTTDQIGYWAFCTISDCDCFIDIREEDDTIS